jgi:hypothetical protein
MGRLLSMLVLVGALAGCHDPVTEVVVVMPSDLEFPGDAENMSISYNTGPLPPMIGGFGRATQGTPLFGLTSPLSLGFASGGEASSFSLTIQLFHGVNQVGMPNIVISRTVTDIRFLEQKIMMLTLPLLRACACAGTSCPSTDNPDCSSLNHPALQPFDRTVAEPSSMMLLAP